MMSCFVGFYYAFNDAFIFSEMNSTTCPCHLQETTTSNVTMKTDNGGITHGTIGVIVFSISSALVAFAFVSNLCIQTLLLTRRALRKQTYTVLVLSLGFGDILISISGILWLVLQKANISFQTPLCGMMLSLFVIGTFLSLYITFLICLNRFLVTVDAPMNKILFSGTRKFWLMIIPSLIDVILIMSLSPLWGKNITQCNVKSVFGGEKITFGVVLMLTNIPLLVSTIVLYIALVRKLMKNFVNVDVQSSEINSGVTMATSTHEKKQQRMRAVKTLGIILVFLVFCTSPFIFSMVGSLFGIELKQTHRIILTWAQMINAFANPIIYTWRIRTLQYEIRNIFSGCHQGFD
ncbi:hypothetical protein FSP39_024070 [Pinctada imbricata]|uniref:G-protein coupled receptors family 1 profile domain-containing protein n=1 Tax=Pinctada imbricata TaxID=66713 RepID=A0AA89BRT9_PINIB|nr:hypothetical protein FSP39_024070 [Pinctada imbricata]